MLLKVRLPRSIADDRGVAMVPVLIVMAVGLTVSAMLTSSVVSGLNFAGSARAAVQSQAAADAGIAAARAGLYNGDCAQQHTPATYSSTGALSYTATVQRLVSGLWQTGCPTNVTPQVRVLSTGRAVDSAGNPVGAPTTVEAIYNYISPGVVPSGTAMYLYGGGVVQANSSFDFSKTPGAGLVVKKGDLVCGKNNTTINGDVLVNGNLDVGTNSCAINGNAWVSGAVTLGPKGTISGNLVAGSVTPNPPGSQVGGTVTLGGAVPSAAGWTDISYVPSDWVDSNGHPYQVITLSGSSCTQNGGPLGGAPNQPTIINALACPNGIQVTNNTTFRLTSDVVIFAPMFSWGSTNQLNFASSDSTEHRLWFMTPDNVADGNPTCQSTEGDFAINNSFQIQAPIDAVLYTPCAFAGNNGFAWRGQIYAGSYSSVMNNPSFTFVPVGIAGYDLNNGTRTPPLTDSQPGTLISNRNITTAP